jgi:hypothetical protein
LTVLEAELGSPFFRELEALCLSFPTSKESLDNLLLTLEMHPSGDVHHAIHHLWPQFHEEHARYSLGNLTKKDPVSQFLRKLDGKSIPDP